MFDTLGCFSKSIRPYKDSKVRIKSFSHFNVLCILNFEVNSAQTFKKNSMENNNDKFKIATF